MLTKGVLTRYDMTEQSINNGINNVYKWRYLEIILKNNPNVIFTFGLFLFLSLRGILYVIAPSFSKEKFCIC